MQALTQLLSPGEGLVHARPILSAIPMHSINHPTFMRFRREKEVIMNGLMPRKTTLFMPSYFWLLDEESLYSLPNSSLICILIVQR